MIRDLWSMTDRHSKMTLAWLIALAALAALAQGAAFVALLPLLSALAEGDDATAWRFTGVIAGLAAAHAVLSLAAGTVGRANSAAVLSSLLRSLGERVLTLPLGYVTKSTAGRFSEMASSGMAFAASVPHVILRPVIAAVVTPTVIALGILAMDWRVGLVLVASAPVLFFAYRAIGRVGGESDEAHADAVAAVSGRLIEFTRGQQVIRAAGDGSAADAMVDEAIQAQHDAFAKATSTQGAAIGRLGSVVHAVFTAAVVVAVAVAATGGMSPAHLAPMLIVVVQFTGPITTAGALSGGFGAGRNTLAALRELRAIPVLPEPAAPELPDGHDVEFRGVSFGYGEKKVLDGVSFRAPQGVLVAIVGPSGAGKTTVMRLLSRFHDPDSGEILIGGVPLPRIGTDGVNSLVTPVFQETFLFDASVRDNVVFADPGFGSRPGDGDRLREAARRSGVDRIVELLPSGWDNPVGEEGTLLSGGERQRVAIARALLKDSPVVLFDEPTSSLDAATERAIVGTMEALRGDRTVIVVAHRLHTVRDADLIVVLSEDGTVAERGTHDELLAKGGRYAESWTCRTGGSPGA